MTLINFQIKFIFLGLIFADKVSNLFCGKRARGVSNILFNVVYQVKLSIPARGTILHSEYRLELHTCLSEKQRNISSKR